MTLLLDKALVVHAKRALESAPRKHITVPVLLAVIMQESGGCSYFLDVKPGSIYKMNVFGATSYLKKKADGTKERIYTGFDESQIRKMALIEAQVGTYIIKEPYVGKISKFRFEPAYWEKYSNLIAPIRFLFSCSWGLPQFMGPNICKVLDESGAQYIKRWRADINMQLTDACKFIDNLLEHAHGNVNHMYRGYNSGNINSENKAVLERAASVEKLARMYEIQLGGN